MDPFEFAEKFLDVKLWWAQKRIIESFGIPRECVSSVDPAGPGGDYSAWMLWARRKAESSPQSQEYWGREAHNRYSQGQRVPETSVDSEIYRWANDDLWRESIEKVRKEANLGKNSQRIKREEIKVKLIRAAVASPEKRKVLLSDGYGAFDLPCAPSEDPETLEAWQEFCWALYLSATKFDHPAALGAPLQGAAELLRWANPVLEVLT